MQTAFDKLYADSVSGRQFRNLVELIKRPENIMLAYRNLRKNSGSKTAGVDKKTISDLNKWSDKSSSTMCSESWTGMFQMPFVEWKYRKTMGRNVHWAFLRLWTGWFNSASYKCWNLSVKRSFSSGAMDSDRLTVQKMRLHKLNEWFRILAAIMWSILIFTASLITSTMESFWSRCGHWASGTKAAFYYLRYAKSRGGRNRFLKGYAARRYHIPITL